MLKLNLTNLYVDDQDKALKFYTDVLGFTKKDDFSNHGFRWLTVASPNGVELQLAAAQAPHAKAYQHAMFESKQPALMLSSDDIKGDFERIKGKGGSFTMPPTDVTMSTIAMINDGCGNLVQLTQLNR